MTTEQYIIYGQTQTLRTLGVDYLKVGYEGFYCMGFPGVVGVNDSWDLDVQM